MNAKLKECPFCGGKAVESEWPEGGATGKVYCLGLGNNRRPDTKWGFLRECPIGEKEFDKKDWENRFAIEQPESPNAPQTPLENALLEVRDVREKNAIDEGKIRWDFWDIGLTPSPKPVKFSFPIEGHPIAPPVAAGSVDSSIDFNFNRYHVHIGGATLDKNGAYVEYADAISWGAQKHAAGYAKKISDAECGALAMLRIERERAEKAEAELSQVNEWRAAALTESQKLGELWASKVEQAEARVKELEQAAQDEANRKYE